MLINRLTVPAVGGGSRRDDRAPDRCQPAGRPRRSCSSPERQLRWGRPRPDGSAQRLSRRCRSEYSPTYGVLPSTATFVDMFLVWGALAAALVRRRGLPSQAVWPFRFLVGLTLCALASAAMNRTELLRPFVYVLLLGTPFAVVLALVIDRPTTRDRRLLGRVLLAALLVQIPVAFAQSQASGNPDDVQGTLLGAGAGAHVISAITMIGAIWVFVTLPRTLAVRLAIAVPLVLITFLADAKQVVLALPAMVIAGNWRGKWDVAIRVSAVAVAVVALFTVVPAGATARKFIDRTRSGQGGKEAAAATVFGTVKTDLPSLVLGLGPAESVSRAAFMTTPLLLQRGLPAACPRTEPGKAGSQGPNGCVRCLGRRNVVRHGHFERAGSGGRSRNCRGAHLRVDDRLALRRATPIAAPRGSAGHLRARALRRARPRLRLVGATAVRDRGRASRRTCNCAAFRAGGTERRRGRRSMADGQSGIPA